MIRIGETITVSAAVGRYRSHPSLARSPSGEWLLLFSDSGVPRDELIHPPNDPRFVNLLTRSSDRGRTWSAPVVVPDPSWTGVECSGITVLSDGTLLVNQFRFDWRPVDEARRLWREGRVEPFVLGSASGWRPARSDEDLEAHPLPYVRADLGSFVHRSTDAGRSWETVRLSIEPYRGAFSPKGAVELPGGEVLLALGSHAHDPLAAIVVLRSPDGGRTWSGPTEVARVPGLVFSEPTSVGLGAARVAVFAREETTGYVYRSVSDDAGRTWEAPVRLSLWGYPQHALRLADGRLLLVYGVRRPPFAIRASLSEDDGATWSPEVTIRGDLVDSRRGLNLGYPSVLEDRPGELFVAYYAEDEAGTVGIRGTFVCLA